jgi:hypothetical protein
MAVNLTAPKANGTVAHAAGTNGVPTLVVKAGLAQMLKVSGGWGGAASCGTWPLIACGPGGTGATGRRDYGRGQRGAGAHC